jgi:hypothetical protein
VSIVVALLSLGVAVLFNALAVRDSARQSELSRQSADLNTLFQVNEAAAESFTDAARTRPLVVLLFPRPARPRRTRTNVSEQWSRDLELRTGGG